MRGVDMRPLGDLSCGVQWLRPRWNWFPKLDVPRLPLLQTDTKIVHIVHSSVLHRDLCRCFVLHRFKILTQCRNVWFASIPSAHIRRRLNLSGVSIPDLGWLYHAFIVAWDFWLVDPVYLVWQPWVQRCNTHLCNMWSWNINTVIFMVRLWEVVEVWNSLTPRIAASVSFVSTVKISSGVYTSPRLNFWWGRNRRVKC